MTYPGHGYGTSVPIDRVEVTDFVFSTLYDLGSVVEISRGLVTIRFTAGNLITFRLADDRLLPSSMVHLRSCSAPCAPLAAGALARVHDQPMETNPFPKRFPFNRAAWFAGWIQCDRKIREFTR